MGKKAAEGVEQLHRDFGMGQRNIGSVLGIAV